jgi:hypothetical protein
MRLRLMRKRRPRRAPALGALLILMIALASPVQVSANALDSTKRTVNCAELGNTVSGTLESNLVITEHGSKCVITGTVRGNVKVRDDSTICAPPPEGTGQEDES